MSDEPVRYDMKAKDQEEFEDWTARFMELYENTPQVQTERSWPNTLLKLIFRLERRLEALESKESK
jgi:hypothetical protein